jgi:HSP20 family protein
MALARRQNALRTRPMRGYSLSNGDSFSNLFGDFDRVFGELAAPAFAQGQWAQAYPVDLYETAETLVLEMAVPGIAAEDLDISIEGRQLSIRGQLPENEDDGRRYWLQSIPHGQFSRTVTLPTNVEHEQIDARVENGLLRLTMPKVAEAQARKIAINQD